MPSPYFTKETYNFWNFFTFLHSTWIIFPKKLICSSFGQKMSFRQRSWFQAFKITLGKSVTGFLLPFLVFHEKILSYIYKLGNSSKYLHNKDQTKNQNKLGLRIKLAMLSSVALLLEIWYVSFEDKPFFIKRTSLSVTNY